MHLQSIVHAQRKDRPRAVVAVSTAHEVVMRAVLAEAARTGTLALLEAPAAEVHQGAYTTPADFMRRVQTIADEVGAPQVLVGGGHVGPRPWADERPHRAMANAHRLIREQVAAGFGKIHIDAAARTQDDPNPMPLSLMADRTADLIATAEQVHKGLPVGLQPPVYVIGTHLRPPGGLTHGEPAPTPTDPEDLVTLLGLMKEGLLRRRLGNALPRIVAIAVETGHTYAAQRVVAYGAPAAAPLVNFARAAGLMLETHSADYQSAAALRQMVRDRFGVLRVGPALTFAYREAIFALVEIEAEVFGTRRSGSGSVRDVLTGLMRNTPDPWRDYTAYKAPESDWLFAYSDRVRLFWSYNIVRSAVATLFANLQAEAIPLTLLSQYMPHQYEAVRRGELDPTPAALTQHTVTLAYRHYTSEAHP